MPNRMAGMMLWHVLAGCWVLSHANASESVVFPDQFEDQFAATAADFVEKSATGLNGRRFSAWMPETGSERPSDCGNTQLEPVNLQAYSIEVDDQAVSICANSPAALVYATSRLQNIIASGSLHSMRISEAPAIETRALHIVLRSVSIESLNDIVRRARLARFNTLIVMLTNGVALDTYPSTVLRNALSKDDLRQFAIFARQNGLNVIPEIKLLTHQQVFLQSSSPDLMFNKATYDPRNNDVYEIVADYIDEVVSVVAPTAIHIGHDEVRAFGNAARRRWLEAGERPLSPELFLRDVQRLHQILSDRGLAVWMWGDMLLQKEMLAEILQRSFSERAAYADLISAIPKDIIMIDWRYFDTAKAFPSIDYFHDFGFQILGATWHDLAVTRGLTKYMAAREWVPRGMVATTWSMVPRGEWDSVHEIIDVSGKVFWDGD